MPFARQLHACLHSQLSNHLSLSPPPPPLSWQQPFHGHLMRAANRVNHPKWRFDLCRRTHKCSLSRQRKGSDADQKDQRLPADKRSERSFGHQLQGLHFRPHFRHHFPPPLSLHLLDSKSLSRPYVRHHGSTCCLRAMGHCRSFVDQGLLFAEKVQRPVDTSVTPGTDFWVWSRCGLPLSERSARQLGWPIWPLVVSLFSRKLCLSTCLLADREKRKGRASQRPLFVRQRKTEEAPARVWRYAGLFGRKGRRMREKERDKTERMTAGRDSGPLIRQNGQRVRQMNRHKNWKEEPPPPLSLIPE